MGQLTRGYRDSGSRRAYHRSPLRLVTYDRRGHRRLGALLEGRVVDLPDLIGHPAYPDTMERLVRSNGGTVLDAARAALERSDAERFVRSDARLLVPLIPSALRTSDTSEGLRRVVGPDEVVPWPEGAGWLEFRPKIAAVLRRPVEDPLRREDVPAVVLGYTLVGDFLIHPGSGDPGATEHGSPVALGPSVVTPDELDPQTTYVTVTVNGEEWAKGNLNGTARTLLAEVAVASREGRLAAGEAFTSGPFELTRFDQRLWPGAVVEMRAEVIGVLRTQLGTPT